MVAGSPQLQLMPMFHLAGLSQALQCLLTGGTLHVLSAFDATRVVDEIERNAIQFFTAAPTIIAALIDEVRGRPERPELGSLREIQYGAAPMPEPLLRDAIEVLGCRFRQIYGMTEAQSFVSLLHPRDHVPGSPRLRTAGQVALGWEVRIVDHAGDDVAVGDPGELLIRSDALFPGYYRDPDATAAAFTEDGWYRTGDVGTLDHDGYLSIVDRAKDMVITGGENVYPAEVEAVLRGHPDVEDVAVIGIPDERWGERVHAVVVARVGTSPDPDEIIGWTRERLAHFKCPRSVELVDELPRNATGKILKRDLRDRHVEAAADADTARQPSHVARLTRPRLRRPVRSDHGVEDVVAARHAPGVVGGDGGASVHRSGGEPGDVGLDDDVVQLDEWAARVERLRVEDVETGRPEASRSERGDEGGFVDDLTTSGVDEDGTRSHELQLRRSEHAVGGVGERDVHRHHVAGGEQLVERPVRVLAVGVGGGVDDRGCRTRGGRCSTRRAMLP